MTPAHCRVSTRTSDGSYGDCVRACIATILDLSPDDVPHFYHDGDGEAGMQRARDWLGERGQSLFVTVYSGEADLEAVLSLVGRQNPGATYMLFGATAEGENHCVVCQGDAVVWNPAWFGSAIVQPLTDNGFWGVGVIAVK